MFAKAYYIKTASPAFLVKNHLQTAAAREKEVAEATPNERTYRYALLQGEELGRKQAAGRCGNVLKAEAAEDRWSLLRACPELTCNPVRTVAPGFWRERGSGSR
jgi:hypothetical protein